MSQYKEATVDGQLPDDYSLPDFTDGEGDVSFADGALDGITIKNDRSEF